MSTCVLHDEVFGDCEITASSWSFDDCEDGDSLWCYIAADICPAYAWPGGYPIVYVAVTRNSIRAGETTMCAHCATETKMEARLKLRAFGGTYPDSLVDLISRIHYEGPDIECEGTLESCHCGLDAVIESAYGENEEEAENGGW